MQTPLKLQKPFGMVAADRYMGGPRKTVCSFGRTVRVRVGCAPALPVDAQAFGA